MGIFILGALALYLLTTIGIVWWAIRHAKKNGKSLKKWGWGAALVMYLIPFWDWIPTLGVHQYYCAKESGFWVYKTLDQWNAENPEVMETLVENSNSPESISPDWPLERRPDMNIAHINQRFGMAYKNHLLSSDERKLLFNVWRWKYELQDKKTGEILARQVDFSTGNGYLGGEPPVKFWLQNEHCMSGREQSRNLNEFVKQFKGAKK
jgi:hypothetical protein